MAYLAVFLIVAFIIFIIYKMGQRSGYALYHTTAKATLDKEGDYYMAIYRGLEQLSHRPPFKVLDSGSITYIAMLMSPLKDITLLKGFILEAEKKRDASILMDGEKMRSFIRFVKTKK